MDLDARPADDRPLRTDRKNQRAKWTPPLDRSTSPLAHERSVVLAVRQGQASGGANAPSLTDRCARRFTVGPPALAPSAPGGALLSARFCSRAQIGQR